MRGRSNRRIYTWREFRRDLDRIERLFRSHFDLSELILFSVAFGGVPLGVSLKNRLGVPLYIIDPKRLDHFPLQLYSSLSFPVLLDDISDTGRTLKKVCEAPVFKNFNIYPFTLTLFCKPTTTFVPNVFLHSTRFWVVFPWE